MIKNEIITFGSYEWRVLDPEGDNALIIAKDVIELRWYNDKFADTTWAGCELRAYLNNDFYNTFSQEEKSQIAAVTNSNPNNPWFNTPGGTETTDQIFLLSLDEVCKYFGDSTEKLLEKGSQKWLIDDRNNHNRQAKYGDRYHWWRLRSPGYYGRTSASVNSSGHVYVRGNGVHGRPKDGGGVRPALWLKTPERHHRPL